MDKNQLKRNRDYNKKHSKRFGRLPKKVVNRGEPQWHGDAAGGIPHLNRLLDIPADAGSSEVSSADGGSVGASESIVMTKSELINDAFKKLNEKRYVEMKILEGPGDSFDSPKRYKPDIDHIAYRIVKLEQDFDWYNYQNAYGDKTEEDAISDTVDILKTQNDVQEMIDIINSEILPYCDEGEEDMIRDAKSIIKDLEKLKASLEK